MLRTGLSALSKLGLQAAGRAAAQEANASLEALSAVSSQAGTRGLAGLFTPSTESRSSEPASCSSPAPRGLPSVGAVRRMSLCYARKFDGRKYDPRADAADLAYTNLTDYLVQVCPQWITMAVAGPAQSANTYNEPTVYTKPEYLVPLCRFLRDHVNTQAKCLIDITAVDYPERAQRFEVVYHLLSPRWNNRLRIKVLVDELTPVPSIAKVYSAANWFERETWDMFGVFFSDHPDLRRILTDYGFTGHPLRKDFPLTGYTEVRYDFGKKRVISEPLELSQEFRYFDFASPWDTLPR